MRRAIPFLPWRRLCPMERSRRFRAQVDITAPLDQLTITISHPNHPEYVFDPANGSVLLNVVDSGAAMDMLTAIPITAMANDTFADAYTLYVSTQMMPTDPALDTPVDVIGGVPVRQRRSDRPANAAPGQRRPYHYAQQWSGSGSGTGPARRKYRCTWKAG